MVKALQAGQMPQVSNNIWISEPDKRGCYVADTGNGMFRLPDYNGVQPSSIGALFVRGGNGFVSDGKVQGDAIRNIKGKIGSFGNWANTLYNKSILSAPFSVTAGDRLQLAAGGGLQDTTNITFDVSDAVPTAEENRPVNVTGCWIIKLFGSISNTSVLDVSKIAAEYAALSTRLSVMESPRFTVIYPNGSEASPASISTSTRMVIDNPFDTENINLLVEIKYNGLNGLDWGGLVIF